MRKKSPLKTSRKSLRASPHKSPRKSPRKSSRKSPLPSLRNDAFAQWCADNNPHGRRCDYPELTRYPGNDERLWETLRSPGDGHCFYHSIRSALRLLRNHPELTKVGGHEPLCTAAIRDVVLTQLRKRYEAYRETKTSTPEALWKMQMWEQRSAIRNADAGLQDARANRSTSHWALDVEIQATSTALNLCIAVWEGTGWTLCFPEPSGDDLANRTHCRHAIYLISVGAMHFDTLVPTQPPARTATHV